MSVSLNSSFPHSKTSASIAHTLNLACNFTGSGQQSCLTSLCVPTINGYYCSQPDFVVRHNLPSDIALGDDWVCLCQPVLVEGHSMIQRPCPLLLDVIGHDFHSYFWSVFDPTSSLSFLYPFSFMSILLMSFAFMFQSCSQHTTRTQFDWYSTGLPTPNIGCQTATRSTWLPNPQNSPSLLRPPNPALELLWRPSLAPTIQSSRLPRHRAQVGVHRLHEDPD